MGVMECSRKDCDGCMCSAYNSNTGYVCYECLSELRERQKLEPSMSIEDIKEFMETAKVDNYHTQPMINLDSFFGIEQ